jgi:hypothetical protein
MALFYQPQDVVVMILSWPESHGHGICNFSRPLIISIYQNMADIWFLDNISEHITGFKTISNYPHLVVLAIR